MSITFSYLQYYRYFPEIFNMSGQGEMVKKYGDWFSHDHTARANIFRRDQGKVLDMDGMMKLMRWESCAVCWWQVLGIGTFKMFTIRYNINTCLMIQYLIDISKDTSCLLVT